MSFKCNNNQKIVEKFKEHFIAFISELHEKFPKDANLILVKTMTPHISSEKIFKRFSEIILPQRDLIFAKDEKFFTNPAPKTAGSSDNFNTRLENIKKIWNTGGLDEDDKETVWIYFILFATLCQSYDFSVLT